MADPTITCTSGALNVVVAYVKTKPHLATNVLIVGNDKTNAGNSLRIMGTYEQLANLARRIEQEIYDLQNGGT